MGRNRLLGMPIGTVPRRKYLRHPLKIYTGDLANTLAGVLYIWVDFEAKYIFRDAQ
ncbi:hypothetical protein L211DRAFT_529457 [Terfezia boudieri ATCC MYA-4762]|uniref:Uncharacterized protein n=1 Tax=Terfezia boudieri ATCC MYA-4762 TaxID=1051890 RepID=A0A3N4LEZ1_9PEZI|nr:hypothetical protein L211DRAFT_898287 [Terfezia boudieri ATCC MYA-4762]RPB20210.1 hypothetical protein L211DRAFT_529457 [Terfezia boudieri ATCC MYA-4762]